MHFVIWCLFALLLNNDATASSRVDDVILKFIMDLSTVPVLYPPLKISLHLCTISYDETIKLSREMSSYGLIHGIRNSNEDFDHRIHNNIEHRNLYVLDLECDYAIETLQQAHSKRMFVAPTKWLLLQDRRIDNNDSVNLTSTYNDTVLEIFEDLAVYPDSDVLLARRSDGNFLSLLSVYRPSPQRGVIWENRGNWTIENGLRMRTFNVASARRRNLQQTALKTAFVVLYPDYTINHLDDFEDVTKDANSRINYQWVRYLAERMNATVSFVTVNTWGLPNKNGTWSGIIGLLQRHEIDIGGSPIYMLQNRLNVVQYVQLYTRLSLTFIFRRPLLSTVKNIFTLPFERHVWNAIAVLLLLVFCLLYISMKWEHYQAVAKKSAAFSNPSNIKEPTISDNIFILLGAFSQQGFSYEPYKVPTRIVTLMLLVASLSLYAAYTANIVALLQSTTDSIKTPADLLNCPLTLGIQNYSFNRYYFKVFNDSVRKAIYKQKIEPYGNRSWIGSLEEGIRRIRTETFAFFTGRGPAYDIIQRTYKEEEKCRLSEIDYLNLLYPLTALPKQSPYLEIIKNGALKLQEYGLKYRAEYHFYQKKPKCTSNTDYINIGFTECYFAIVSMGYGMLLSIIVFVFELLWQKITNKDVKNEDIKQTERNCTVMKMDDY